MGETLQSGIVRNATSIAVLVAIVVIVTFGVFNTLPHQSENDSVEIGSSGDLVRAYAQVKPGLTRASQLAQLGFNRYAPNVQVLSYLGVVERIMPRDSVTFDRLSGPLKDCIAARDRCTALVFQPAQSRVRAAGMLSMFGFGTATAASAPAQVTLFVRNGRVTYKTIDGVAPAAPGRVATAAISASRQNGSY